MNILIEYLLVFIISFVFNYFYMIKGYGKFNSKQLPTLILYLKKFYNVSVNKDNYKSILYICAFTNSFIIDTIYIILIYLVHNMIIMIIIGIILLILLTIICYGIIGRYYNWKEGR